MNMSLIHRYKMHFSPLKLNYKIKFKINYKTFKTIVGKVMFVTRCEKKVF